MDSVVEGKVQDYLWNAWHYQPQDRRAILDSAEAKARMAGHELDCRFAYAGLGAGPEARAASRLVGRALGIWGDETADYFLKREMDEWLRVSPKTRA